MLLIITDSWSYIDFNTVGVTCCYMKRFESHEVKEYIGINGTRIKDIYM